MRKRVLIILALAVVTFFNSCKDLEEMNVNPNEPSAVTTANLLSGSQKKMLDFIYDNWFSGRQALVYSQYWAQVNYTEEDRYQIRESVNNNYFNTLYTVAGNFVTIEEMNKDEKTKDEMSAFGANENQIAVAKILKVWLMQQMADTWGAIPYSEAFKLNDDVFYPKYDDLNVLYYDLIDELTVAINLIDVAQPAFTSGDLIYNGDASLWKKFGNSLKARLALRVSKVDSNWKKYIQEAVKSGVFESNDDQAIFQYSLASPNECYFYRGYYVDKRNDFSIAKPFVTLLKGENDALNSKVNPFAGVVDPRLNIFAGVDGSTIDGVPYGVPSDQMGKITEKFPNFYNVQPVGLNADFSVQLMTYAELCFILSEYEGYSSAWYEKGVRASVEWWSTLNGTPLSTSVIDSYVDAVNDVVNAETVATQKYIHLYMYGTESWAEYRRTGYPKTLLKPTEISTKIAGEDVIFEPLSDTKSDLPARIKYPTNESTLNPEPFKAAVAKLADGTNNYYSKMFWDVRTTADPNPQNK